MKYETVHLKIKFGMILRVLRENFCSIVWLLLFTWHHLVGLG